MAGPAITSLQQVDEADNMLVCGNSCFSLDQSKPEQSYRWPPGVELGASYGSYLLHSQGGARVPARIPAKTKQGGSSIPKLPPIAGAATKGHAPLGPVSEADDSGATDTESSLDSFCWSRSGGGVRARHTRAVTRESATTSPSLQTLTSDLRFLIDSLVDLKQHLVHCKVINPSLVSLCDMLLPAHDDLRAIVNRLSSHGGQSDHLMVGESLQLVMLYLHLITQSLGEQVKLLRKGKFYTEQHDPSATSKVSDGNTVDDRKNMFQLMKAQETELNTLRRLYQATKAELQGTRNQCDKLARKLEASEAQVQQTGSEMNAQLVLTKKLLAQTTAELEEERKRVQYVKLHANHHKRELTEAKKVQPARRALEKQLDKLRNQLEDQHELEKNLRRQLEENSIRVKKLASQLKEKKSAYQGRAMLGITPAKKGIIKDRSTVRVHVPQEASKRSPYNVPPVAMARNKLWYGGNPSSLAQHHSSQLQRPTIQCSAEELADLAQFPDQRRAMETLRMLGILH